MNLKRIIPFVMVAIVLFVPLSLAEDTDGDSVKLEAKAAYFDGMGFVLEFSEGLTGNFTCYVMDDHGNKVAGDLVIPLVDKDIVRLLPNKGVVVTDGMYNAVMTSLDVFVAERIEVKISATSIELNKETLELNVGQEYQLRAYISPENVSDQEISWVSSDSSVASVSPSGKVIAKAEGKATITASISGGLSAKCTVTVTDNSSIKGVELDVSRISMDVGDSRTLKATVTPSGLQTSFIWTSSNPNVASVDGFGNVTALSKGTAVITVETADGGKTDSCTVSVKNVPVKGVDIPSEYQMTVGSIYVLDAIVNPSNATITDVTWLSSDPGVVTVDSNGKITAVAAGTAVITVKTVDGGKTDTCTVTVTDLIKPVEGIKLDKVSATMEKGQTIKLTVTVTPADATNKNVLWTSSDENVATVDSNGSVTAVSVGTAVIIATASDGGLNATCTVTVTDANPGPVDANLNVDAKGGVVSESQVQSILQHINDVKASDPSAIPVITIYSTNISVLSVDARVISAIRDSGSVLNVGVSQGSILFVSGSLDRLNFGSGSTVKFGIEVADIPQDHTQFVDGAPVYSIFIKIDDAVFDLGFNHPVSVNLNYTIPSGFDAGDVHVYCLKDGGNTEEISSPKYFYDGTGGIVSFDLEHFSLYTIKCIEDSSASQDNDNVVLYAVCGIFAIVVVIAAIFVIKKRNV